MLTPTHKPKKRKQTARRRAGANPCPGLYQRGETYWLKHYHDGAAYRESLGTTDLSVAVQKAEMARRRPLLETSGSWKAEVAEYLGQRRREDRLSVRTAESRRYALLAESARMGWGRPATLSTASIQGWYEGLRRTHAEKTAREYFIHLRGFLAWMVEQSRLRENPALGVRLARVRSNPRKNFCARETVEHLLAECADAEMRFILLCGFHAGMRKDEIINARPDWFALGAGRLDVRIRPPGTLGKSDPGWRPKGRKERSIPLTAEFRAFLASGAVDLSKEGSPFVLRPTKKAGRARYRYDFKKAFQAHLAKCGVTGVTTHDMRRTFASLRVSKGTSVYLVAKWLGDGLETTERHYGHLGPSSYDQIEL